MQPTTNNKETQAIEAAKLVHLTLAMLNQKRLDLVDKKRRRLELNGNPLQRLVIT